MFVECLSHIYLSVHVASSNDGKIAQLTVNEYDNIKWRMAFKSVVITALVTTGLHAKWG